MLVLILLLILPLRLDRIRIRMRTIVSALARRSADVRREAAADRMLMAMDDRMLKDMGCAAATSLARCKFASKECSVPFCL